ncbi:TRAP transporter small permease [Thalassorhabdomicrobium marinisediminis]|uniref:TRAP transporter small permease n=1 Tax=Thalassorhabdomicrobium marinisediminis TaxID=2170577 RepID=UPI0024900ECE|nr:TRAP transporter small permease [Thalassorhabdomicrobium marinisediminis]
MSFLEPLRRRVGAVLLWVEQGTVVIGCILIWAIFALILAQMFGRVLFRTGLPWADELARYLHILMVFIGIGYAHRVGAHISIDILVHMLPRVPRRVLHIIVQAAILATSIIVVMGCWMLIQRMGAQRSASLGLPVTAFVTPTLLGFGLLAVEAFCRIFLVPDDKITVEGVEVNTL